MVPWGNVLQQRKDMVQNNTLILFIGMEMFNSLLMFGRFVPQYGAVCSLHSLLASDQESFGGWPVTQQQQLDI